MARRTISLVLAQLNMNFAISYSRYYYLKKRQRLWEPVLIGLAIASGAITIAVGVYKVARFFYSATAPIGQGDVTLTLGILASQVIVLILGFVLVIAVFYFSNDLSILIPLPLRPAEVLASKFAVILANEYLGLAVFVIPVLVAYGLLAGVGAVPYAITAVLVFLALPVVPLVIAAIPAILLMRVAGLSRRKDTLAMIGGFMFVALVVGFQIFIQTRAPGRGEEAEFLTRVLSTANSLVDIVGSRFPPSIWATKALAGAGTLSGLLNLALFLGAGALAFAALLAIGNRVFYQGVLSGFEAAARSNDRSAARLRADRYAERSPVASLAVTEMKLFARTPVFALNGFTGFVMFPVMFVVIFFVRRTPEMARIWESFISAPGFEAIGALVVGAYFLALTALSSIPFSAFSREGKRNIWIPKTLPVAGRTVALGKAVAAEIMILLGALPGVAVLEYMVRLPLVSLAAGIALGVISSFTLCLWGVLFDMRRPMLNWTDQQKAVKSNLNTLFGALFGIAAIVALGFVVHLGLKAGVAGWAVVAVVGGIATVLLVAAIRVLDAAADRIWRSLEV
ncbi:MAG: putative ABC transporter permease subunit [Bacillota bacterium]